MVSPVLSQHVAIWTTFFTVLQKIKSLFLGNIFLLWANFLFCNFTNFMKTWAKFLTNTSIRSLCYRTYLTFVRHNPDFDLIRLSMMFLSFELEKQIFVSRLILGSSFMQKTELRASFCCTL